MKVHRLSDAFDIQRNMMSVMGYWHTETLTYFYIIRSALTTSIFLISYIGMIMQFIHVIGDFQKLSEILYMMTSYTSYFCKLLGYLYSRQTFLSMLRHLKNPIFQDYSIELEHHLTKILRLSILITKLYRVSCAIVVILFCVYPIFDNAILPTPVPFDTGRYTFIMYIIESLALLIAAWNNFCLDTLSVCLMGLAISQFDILKEKFVNFKQIATKTSLENKRFNIESELWKLESNTDNIIKHTLTNCIIHHNALIRFVNQIETIFSFGLLAQLLGSIIVICNTGFFLLLVSPASLQFGMLFSYFITMMAQLMLYCWYGNEIMLKSTEIGESCYLSDWYTCNLSVRKSIFIVMERSRRPLVISALKFSILSLTALTSVCYRPFVILSIWFNWILSDNTMVLFIFCITSTFDR
ncbi:odorant receptor [Holotrichia oblita]|uniref:Odorant receptor n=1 Tax=Holotrichia oblita TaxID=644536 RepID=A0ACB9TDE4_HOLOL|nr:odorant receptor [Holotrichia oblita]